MDEVLLNECFELNAEKTCAYISQNPNATAQEVYAHITNDSNDSLVTYEDALDTDKLYDDAQTLRDVLCQRLSSFLSSCDTARIARGLRLKLVDPIEYNLCKDAQDAIAAAKKFCEKVPTTKSALTEYMDKVSVLVGIIANDLNDLKTNG